MSIRGRPRTVDRGPAAGRHRTATHATVGLDAGPTRAEPAQARRPGHVPRRYRTCRSFRSRPRTGSAPCAGLGTGPRAATWGPSRRGCPTRLRPRGSKAGASPHLVPIPAHGVHSDSPVLTTFSGPQHDAAVAEFRDLDARHLRLNSAGSGAVSRNGCETRARRTGIRTRGCLPRPTASVGTGRCASSSRRLPTCCWLPDRAGQCPPSW